MSRSEQEQDDRLLAESLRNEEEKKLREAAKGKEAEPYLKEVMRAAFKMMFYAPERSEEVLPLLKELTSAVPPQSDLPVPAPISESEPRYPKLSGDQKEKFLKDWKKELEQGLLNPILKPSFLGIGHDLFVYSEHTFEGNPLPEFCSISRNILDCFATALLSTPDLDFPVSPLVVRCRLGEEGKNLTLYLTAMLAPGEQILPFELKEESEVWIASKLRPLAKTKGLALGNICWDRSGPHSLFFFDYPGQMIRDRVAGLGAPGEDGKPLWPECELLLDPVTQTLRETAKSAIDLVESIPESPIQ